MTTTRTTRLTLWLPVLPIQPLSTHSKRQPPQQVQWTCGSKSC